jgi:hypothetical protein
MTTLARPALAADHAARGRGDEMDLAVQIGLALFYAYMLIPARVMEATSLFRLEAPDAARRYGIGYPYFTVLELLMVAYVLLVRGTGRVPRAAPNWGLRLYLGVGVLCALWLWARCALAGQPMFWDGPLAALRLGVVYALFVSLPIDNARRIRAVQNGLLLLFVISFILNLGGFANQLHARANLAGRMTAAGFDYSTTGYWGCGLALVSLTLATGRRQALLLAAGLFAATMAGARNPFALFVVCVLLTIYLQRGLGKAAACVLVALALAAGLTALVAPSAFGRLPLFARSLDDPLVYGQGVSPTAETLRLLPFLRAAPPQSPAVLGRINTWLRSARLVPAALWEPLGSDWLVQVRLREVGALSHAHNGYLQTLLKFGVLAVPIWLTLAVGLWRGLRARSPYASLLLFLMASLLVDYWLLVIKSAFLFLAVVWLNDQWMRDQRRSRP